MTHRIATFAVLALLALGLVGCSNPAAGGPNEATAGNPATSFTVSYVDTIASSGQVPVDGTSYQAGTSVTVADNTGNLAKTDQLFTGWNTKADGSGTNYAVGNSFAIGGGNVTLYAVWVPSDMLEMNGTTVYAGRIRPTGKLIIPPGITTIDGDAFFGCEGLTSVTIPNSVTRIGEKAFYGCTGLTSVAIPPSVTRIDFSAFGDDTALTSVTIPGSVTDIGSGAFAGSGLTSVSLLEGVTSLSEGIFENCTGLTSVTIPSSVTSIGSYAFQMCTNLSSVTLKRSIVTHKSITNGGNSAFKKCSAKLVIKVPGDSYPPYISNPTWVSYSSIISGY